MIGKLRVYNSLSREKEIFEPLNAPHVGMYVCGPTVYSDVHLGNVRTFLSFDVIYRYLKFLGYKVRYVRNITDVGHLLDSGEDRISKKATLENLEPTHTESTGVLVLVIMSMLLEVLALIPKMRTSTSTNQ